MSDLIKREDAIEAIANLTCVGIEEIKAQCDRCVADDEGWLGGLRDAVIELETLPSAEPDSEEFEWCHDCKEYDQEKHCCHRWTKVIRKTVEEVKSQYALEYPKIIHCEDCKWWDRLEEGHPYGDCRACRSGTQTERWDIHIQRQCKFDFYCADAEPIEEEDDENED